MDPAPAGPLDLEGKADLLEDLHLQGDSHQAVHQDSLANPLKATETAVLDRHPSTNNYHYLGNKYHYLGSLHTILQSATS